MPFFQIYVQAFLMIMIMMSSLWIINITIKVSGVALLEKSLVEQKPQYKEYIEKTSAFFPWFPKK
jgi:steroid 5-alpha reductase family enzyme